MARALFFDKKFFALGGCLLPSLFVFHLVWADTLTLKNGKDLRGVVVEQHEDRILLSTAKGEIPILRTGIKSIQFDDPEQNYMQVGREYESERKWEEALAYYTKAVELNPNFEDAKKAMTRVRNHFWAVESQGPVDEMEKQQTLYESWGRGRSAGKASQQVRDDQTKELRENLGVAIEKKGDWVSLSQVVSKKDAAAAGLKKNDRLVALDGQSLKYLRLSAVRERLLFPHHTDFTLDFERDCVLTKNAADKDLKSFGLKLKLEYQGLVIDAVDPESAAHKAGLKPQDFLTRVNRASVRYKPLKKVEEDMLNSKENPVVLTVRRSVMLTRK